MEPSFRKMFDRFANGESVYTLNEERANVSLFSMDSIVRADIRYEWAKRCSNNIFKYYQLLLGFSGPLPLSQQVDHAGRFPPAFYPSFLQHFRALVGA
jgi:hypothetical protein